MTPVGLCRHFPGELPRVCFPTCEPAGAIHTELRKLTAVARDGSLLLPLLRWCQSTWCGHESRRIDTDVHQLAEQPGDVRWPAGGKRVRQVGVQHRPRNAGTDRREQARLTCADVCAVTADRRVYPNRSRPGQQWHEPVGNALHVVRRTAVVLSE